MPIPFLANIFKGKAGEIISSIGGVIDNLSISKEEKEAFKADFEKETNRHIEQLEQNALKETEMLLKDMSDARNREIQIATSDKAPLINKIIQPILALFIVIATLTIWALILFRNYEPKTNEAMIVGALTTLAANVLSYYFGSSTGSKSKQEQLDKMSSK